MPRVSIRETIEHAPKVELHLHLEGAIPLPTLWSLVEGRSDDVTSEQELVARFTYRDFPHFIDTWWWMTQFLDTADAFTTIGEAVAQSLVDQNIVYAEASISPSDYARHGLSPQEIATAVRRGIDRVPEAMKSSLTARGNRSFVMMTPGPTNTPSSMWVPLNRRHPD